MKTNKYIIAVISADRVGIISNVTGTILDLGGNIGKMSQTVMDGCFTILLIVDFPGRLGADDVRREIEEKGRAMGLTVSVRPHLEQPPTCGCKADVYFLTMVAKDRKGIVHAITSCLAGHGINILDLYCFQRRQGELVLISEIEMPDGIDLSQVQIDIEAAAAVQQLSVRLQHENLFHATSNLYLTRQEHTV